MRFWRKFPLGQQIILGSFLPGFILALIINFAYWDQAMGFMDSCDLILGVFSLGICHPTGYPFFVSLGHLLSLLFLLPTPVAASLLSVLSGGISVGLTGLLAARLIPQKTTQVRLYAAFLASTLLVVTPLAWSQSVRTEVYALNLMVVLVCLHLALPRGHSEAGNIQPLLLLSFFCGLGLTHHLTFATLMPLLLILVLPRLWRHSKWITPIVGFFFLGLSLMLFMPLRATTHPSADWLQVVRLDRIFMELTGAQFRNKMLVMTPLRIELQLLDLAKLGMQQFPLWIWLGLPFGVWAGWKRKPALFSCIYIIAIGIAIMISYDIFDISVYLIPAFAMATVMVATGLTVFLSTVGSFLKRFLPIIKECTRVGKVAIIIAYAAILVLAGWLFLRNEEEIGQSRNPAAFEFGSHLLRSMPYHAFMQTSDANPSFIVKWLQLGMGMRPDVEHVDPNDQKIRLVQTAHLAVQAADAGRHAYVDYQTLGPDMPEVGGELRARFEPAGLLATISPSSDDRYYDALTLDWLVNEYFPKYNGDPEAVQAVLQPLNERAVAYILTKDFIKAFQFASICADFAPSRPEVLVNRAAALLGLGRRDEAIADLVYVTRVKPGQIEAWGKLGLIYFSMGDKTSAQKAFERALALDGRNYDSNYYLAQLYIDVGRIDDATKLLAHLVELYPKYFEPNLRLGQVLLMQRKAEEAVKYLEKAVVVNPQDGEALFVLGECYLALGRIDAAAQQYRLVLHLNPGDKAARNRLLEIMRQRGASPQ